MDDLILLISKTYGIAGLIMLSPFLGLFVVWKNNIKLQNDLARVQESRVNDAKATTEKMLTLVEESSGTAKETNIALDQVRDLLMHITTTKKQLTP